MKKIKQIFCWYVTLNKRFLKKRIFTVILLCTPLLAIAIRMLPSADSSVLNILLYNEGSQNESHAIMEELENLHGIVHYASFSHLEDAISEVNRGKADSVWVFPKDLKKSFLTYLKNGKAFIKVYLREDTIQTKIVREQLYGTLYPKISYHLLNHFFEEHPSSNRDPQFQSQLDQNYQSFHLHPSILEFSYMDGTAMDTEKENYLTMPLRGMLAIFLLMISMAVGMFYLQDSQDQIFHWMPIKHRALFPYFYILTGSLNGAVLTFFSLCFTGTFSNWKKEVLLLVLYLFAITGFSNLLVLLFKNVKRMGAGILIISLVSLLLCPVFFHWNHFPLFQFLLPPYYYLNSLFNHSMAVKMFLYSLLTFLFGFLFNKKISY